MANRRKWRWYEVIRPVGSLLSPDEENGLSDQGSRHTDARDSREVLLKIQKLLLAHACDPGTSVTLIQDGWRDSKPCGRSKSTIDTEPGWWNLFFNSSRISEGTSVYDKIQVYSTYYCYMTMFKCWVDRCRLLMKL